MKLHCYFRVFYIPAASSALVFENLPPMIVFGIREVCISIAIYGAFRDSITLSNTTARSFRDTTFYAVFLSFLLVLQSARRSWVVKSPLPRSKDTQS